MDDTKFGSHNKRGDYAPNEPAQIAPLFAFPPKPAALLKWLPHYFLPYNLLFGLSVHGPSSKVLLGVQLVGAS